MKNYYRYELDENGVYHLEFTWDSGERFVRLTNPNAFRFMVDMLDRLGYSRTEKKIW